MGKKSGRPPKTQTQPTPEVLEDQAQQPESDETQPESLETTEETQTETQPTPEVKPEPKKGGEFKVNGNNKISLNGVIFEPGEETVKLTADQIEQAGKRLDRAIEIKMIERVK